MASGLSELSFPNANCGFGSVCIELCMRRCVRTDSRQETMAGRSIFLNVLTCDVDFVLYGIYATKTIIMCWKLKMF